jgi:RNA polymerase sigma-70 factor, ECF subfamily
MSASPESARTAELFDHLYAEVRRLARSQMRRERAEHTLSATGLAHEAWLKLNEQTRTEWQNESHFLATAATMMRRILVNHEMARRADKREVELAEVTLSGIADTTPGQSMDVVRVHEALLALEAQDPRTAKVVELRFFGGMEHDEIAAALDVSEATVKREWVFAKAWLKKELG